MNPSRLNGPERLVLGGHTFITQLGNDPAASREEQTAIVRACLAAGIGWFDTTYQPERRALGECLQAIRESGGPAQTARVIAWNFFNEFDSNGALGGPDYYRAEHIDMMLEQLRLPAIDALVVHRLDDPERNARQLALAIRWKENGRVKRLGIWAPDIEFIRNENNRSPYDFMVRPFNTLTPEAPEIFDRARQAGWETFACSPFYRGWQIDKLAAVAERIAPFLGRAAAIERIADHLLRYSLFHPNVDRLIVAMRRTDWVESNVRSAARGPLTDDESNWLSLLMSEAAKTDSAGSTQTTVK